MPFLAPFVVAFALLFSFLGGICFGLYSCGGYVWSGEICWVASALLLGFSLIVSKRILHSWLRRVGFVVSYLCIFTLSQAAAMPLYPLAPESFAEYRHRFVLALEYGPCP